MKFQLLFIFFNIIIISLFIQKYDALQCYVGKLDTNVDSMSLNGCKNGEICYTLKYQSRAVAGCTSDNYCNAYKSTKYNCYTCNGWDEINKRTAYCPNSITSVFKVDKTIYIFEYQNVWKHDGNKIINGPYKIKNLFSPAPEAVNCSCTSSKNIIYLFYYDKVYAYNFTNKFNLIDGYPIDLQLTIVPYPIKCFPLNNGTLMIGNRFRNIKEYVTVDIRGPLSYTYDPERNMPHMSGDFYEQFPNLPQKFISGYPEDNNYNNYIFLDKLNASKYSLNDAKIISKEINIKNYLNCNIDYETIYIDKKMEICENGLKVSPKPEILNN
ncbi:hypothetical protein Mgra_00003277 [Meloidogyne graminicola]|uniref:Uncharacterized protein n=1 Tax=Meloidogyne graminicola TaxID=189291 RepID=A0A8S9ZUP4_9BILA|nr:hypothetical protein Mgra_00003277 [Meloidogyne graminicola]